MIHFPDIRARRFTLRLRELTIGQSLDLASRPAHLEQANTTAFLNHVVMDPDLEPARWRVGERLLAVAHYLACVTGEADFPVGAGHYSDYLVPEEAPVPDTVALGDVVGEPWRLRHLDGRLAEAVERLDLDGIGGRGRWLIGLMAAQMFRDGEADPDAMTEGALDEWLLARAQSFVALPESEFEAMLLAFHDGRDQLTHLFRVDVDDHGLIYPATREAAGLPPARFSVRSNLSPWSRSMARKPQ